MAIETTPISSTGLITKGVTASVPPTEAALRALLSGGSLEARVLASVLDGTLRLATRLGTLEARLARGAAMPEEGLLVTLSVEGADTATGETLLKAQVVAGEPKGAQGGAAAATPSGRAVQMAVASALATQEGLAAAFDGAERLAGGGRDVPPAVRQAGQALLATRVKLEAASTPDVISQSVRSSGVFLEASLAQTGAVPPHDLKAALLGLKTALVTVLGPEALPSPAPAPVLPKTPSEPGSMRAYAPPSAAVPTPPLLAGEGAPVGTPLAPADPGVLISQLTSSQSQAEPSPATSPPSEPSTGETLRSTGVAPDLPELSSPDMSRPDGRRSEDGVRKDGAAPLAGSAPTALAGVVADEAPEVRLSFAFPAPPRAPSGGPQAGTASPQAAPAQGAPLPVAPKPSVNPLMAALGPAAAAARPPGASEIKAPAGLSLLALQELPLPEVGPVAAAPDRPVAAPSARSQPAQDDGPHAAPPLKGMWPAPEHRGEHPELATMTGGDLMKRVLADTDAALSRIVLDQYASLPDEAAGARAANTGDKGAVQHWSFEMPVLVDGRTTSLRFQVDKDGSGKGGRQGQGSAPSWRLRLAFDIEPLGAIRAQVGLVGGRLAVGIWADRASTVAALSSFSGDLRTALAAADFDVDEIHLAEGLPPDMTPKSSGVFVERMA